MLKLKPQIIDRYLLAEFLKPFLLSISILTVILISNYLFELTDLIIVKRVAILRIVELLLYKIPDIVVESLAISVLFATLLAMSQLVKNNELTALRMGGASLQRLLAPLFLLAMIICVVNYLVSQQVVPWANHRAQNIVRQTILEEGPPNLQQGSFFEGGDEKYFYIQQVDNRQGRLEQIIAYEMEEEGFPRLITAEQGYFAGEIWHLEEGMIHKLNDDGEVTYQSDFDELEINLNQEIREFYGQQRTTAEMSRAELRREIELFQESGLNVSSLLVDYHLKLAEVFISLIFVLLGVPLSLKSKQGKAFGVISSIVIMFLYYLLVSFFRSLGRNQMLTPLLAAWLPNLIFVGVAIYLIFKEEYFSIKKH
ncbi:LptF/LptG family permease [Natroniella acetigena]|uniref:LptF/LptG family permease n=1 Tax=Natroniella acetigena TaxID=52004 RepID=UPI00200A62C0|nr:LptF/LptG family permease [Natroniella acetigena]